MLSYHDDRRRDACAGRPVFRGGNDGGSDDGIVLLDKEIRNTPGSVVRPYKRLCIGSGTDRRGTFERDNETQEPFWEGLRQVGDSSHTSPQPAGKGTGGTEQRAGSGLVGERTPACRYIHD